MNWKCILVGAVVFFIVSNILGIFVSGPIIHVNILDDAYQATESFWRPELREDPPNTAALMPMWMLNSAICSLIVAFLYCYFCRCLEGPGWKRGLTFFFFLGLFGICIILGYSGVFALPGKIWMWWAVDIVAIYSIAGSVVGWAVGKWGGCP